MLIKMNEYKKKWEKVNYLFINLIFKYSSMAQYDKYYELEVTSTSKDWTRNFSIYKKNRFNEKLNCISSWLNEKTFNPMTLDQVKWFLDFYEWDDNDLMNSLYEKRDSLKTFNSDDSLNDIFENWLELDSLNEDENFEFVSYYTVTKNNNWKYALRRKSDLMIEDKFWEFEVHIHLIKDDDWKESFCFLWKREKNYENEKRFDELFIFDLKRWKFVNSYKIIQWYHYNSTITFVRNFTFVIIDWDSLYEICLFDFNEKTLDFDWKKIITKNKNFSEFTIITKIEANVVFEQWYSKRYFYYNISEKFGWRNEKALEFLIYDSKKKKMVDLLGIVKSKLWDNSYFDPNKHGRFIEEYKDKEWNEFIRIITWKTNEQWDSEYFLFLIDKENLELKIFKEYTNEDKNKDYYE